MKIAIHKSTNSFHQRWTAYCEQKDIPFKQVNCYESDIVYQLSDCNALMWHHFQTNPKDILFAKALLFSLQQAGKEVFPDFHTGWHFDDKLGQKYLLETIGAPLVPAYVFYEKMEAIEWVRNTDFPKVFKLRGGAGSANVRLVRTSTDAIKLIKKAFGKGFKTYDAWSNLIESFRKFRLGKATWLDLFKRAVRLFSPPEFSRVAGNDCGYVYFQDFIPQNDHDIRVVVIDGKAFAIKRMVRENDFRASGSGNILYDKNLIDIATIKIAFNIHDKLQSQCTAMDFVFDKGEPKLVEISYGFVPEGYSSCPGYWDKDLNWHEGIFNPYGWMIEQLIRNER